MGRYVLTNCYVFDGLGNLFKGSVVVDDGKIVDVGSVGSVEVPKDAEVIDLGGMYLLPGLIDAHLHLVGMRTGDFVKEPLLTPYETFVARVVKDLEELIYSGFTTVGDAGSLIAVKVKQAVNEGTIVGPRIVAAGLTLSPTFGHGDTHYLPIEYVDFRTTRKLTPLASLICDGVDECRKAARY
ncbi:MAG: amidohydrolase family protein, partial [Sulfolobales archaeon]